MKIKVTKISKTVEEVDVEFPIYRKHAIPGDDGDTVILTRIDEELFSVSITRRDSWRHPPAYEIETRQRDGFDDRSGEDYNLGKGEHASSKEEFDAMVAELKKLLVSFDEFPAACL